MEANNDVKKEVIAFIAPDNVLDTGNKYLAQTVSYGEGGRVNLTSDTKISFINNNVRSTLRIDERNLICCLYLNLDKSSIEFLDTKYLIDLRILILNSTNITKVDTAKLLKLEILCIKSTEIKEINVVNLTLLTVLDIS